MCPPTELLLTDRVVDLVRGHVQTPDGVVRLTTTEHAVMQFLTTRLGQAVERDELHTEVWGHAATVLSRALDTTVRRLRRKLEVSPKQPQHLLTVHGTGYRLVAETHQRAQIVGRERDLLRLAQCQDMPIVGLVGVPGVGTSTLARAWQPDAAWLVWSDTGSPHEALATAVGLSPKSARRDLLLALKERTLVVDNASYHAAAVLNAWRTDVPFRLVYTAHQALDIAGQQVVAIGPLDSDASQALLRHIGCAPGDVHALAERGAGHPLTLTRLALDPSGATASLHESFSRLSAHAQRTLAVVFALQPATVSQVDVVIESAQSGLGRLQQAGWLTYQQGAFRVASWVEASIDSTLADADIACVARRIAGRVDAGDSRGVPKAWLDGCTLLRAGVPALLRLGHPNDAARVARAAIRTLHWTGSYEAGVALAEVALQASISDAERVLLHCVTAPLTTGTAHEHHCTQARFLAERTGDPLLRCRAMLTDRSHAPSAMAAMQDAVSLAEQAGRPALLGRVLGKFTLLLAHNGDPRAYDVYMQALEATQRAEDRWEEAIVAGNYAGVLRKVGDVDGAIQRYRDTFTVLGELGDRWNQRAVCTGLGTLLHQLMRFDDADEVYAQGLELAETLGDAKAAGLIRTDRMCLHLDRGAIPSATVLDNALREHRISGDTLYESIALCNQGIAWRRRGQTALARQHMQRALVAAQSINAEWHTHEYTVELAWLDAIDGNTQAAIERCRQPIAALAAIPTRRSFAARYLLARASWGPLEDEQSKLLRELAGEFPDVPGTDWEGLGAWRAG